MAVAELIEGIVVWGGWGWGYLQIRGRRRSGMSIVLPMPMIAKRLPFWNGHSKRSYST